MKQKTSLYAFSVLAFTGLLLTASCKKSNNNVSNSSVISATVGGTSFKSTINVGGYSQSGGIFQLIGYTVVKAGDTVGMQLFFQTPFQLNVPINSVSSGLDIEYLDTKAGAIYDGGSQSGSSTLTVTSWDTQNLKIAGTFSGILVNANNIADSLTVTNGQFNCTYVAEP